MPSIALGSHYKQRASSQPGFAAFHSWKPNSEGTQLQGLVKVSLVKGDTVPWCFTGALIGTVTQQAGTAEIRNV